MSDLHQLPLLTRGLPWPMARAFVHKDPKTGLWCWEHQCAQRLPDKPFHGHPKCCWETAYHWAQLHMEYCL